MAEAYALNPAHPLIFYELAYVPVEPGTGFPLLELYQSTDGGQTWQSVLQHLPWLAPLSPVSILTGSETPDLVYLTNTRCPAAQAFHASGGPLALPLAGSPFSMCMSSDGGKNWRTLSAPSQFAQTMGGGVVDQKGRLYAQVATSGSVEVWRYDPAETWSKGVQAPRGGNVLAGTPAGANGTTVIWFMTTSGQTALFRYVI